MKAGHRIVWICVIAAVVATTLALVFNLKVVETYLFSTFHNSGKLFAYILLSLFLVAVYCGFDRLLFWVNYDLLDQRLAYREGKYLESSFYHHFSTFAQTLKQRKETNTDNQGSEVGGETTIVGEILENAYQHASEQSLDGQEITDSCRLLDYLTSVAPIVGFIGTLAGLMDAFGELANGGDTQLLLSGLGVSMSTSLIGAFISVFCITINWVCNQLNDRLQDHLETITAKIHT